jgi:threonine synthase
LGAARGFSALQKAGLIQNLPRLVGVQARACAPLWALSSYGPDGLTLVSEAATLAEGVRVRYPLRGDLVLKAVEETGGQFLAIDEQAILPGRDQLARRGFYVEPTSALVWNALEQGIDQMPDPVVVLLTGSGLKYSG